MRRYKFFDKQKGTVVQSNGKSNFSQPWKTQSLEEQHKGFQNFMPPSTAQVNAFYQNLGLSRPVGVEQNRNNANHNGQYGNSIGVGRQHVGNVFPSPQINGRNHQGVEQIRNNANHNEINGNSIGEGRHVGNVFPLPQINARNQGGFQYPSQMSFGFDDGMRGGGCYFQ